MNNNKKYDPPVTSLGDQAHAATRAGLGSIPIAGAAAAELLSALILPPLEKRRNEWMKEIGSGLRELEEKMGVVLESLQESDEFIDVAIEATRIAIKSSYREKREALRSAVLNTALGEAPEESLQSMFLAFIDTLTVWHLKLLTLFNDPVAYLEKHGISFSGYSMGAPSHLIEQAFPELRGKRDFYDLVWKDLYSKALVTIEELHVTMTGNGIVSRRTTEIGKSFLEYITSPIDD